MDKQYDTILSYMATIFSSKGIDETLAYEIAMLPGMTQLFSLLKIEEVIRKKTFDIVVLDMPASGEALRYLYFPKLIGSIGRNYWTSRNVQWGCENISAFFKIFGID